MCVDMYTRGLCRILGFGPKSDSQISMEMEKSALPGKYWLAYCELYPPNTASILLRNSKKTNVTYTLQSYYVHQAQCKGGLDTYPGHLSQCYILNSKLCTRDLVLRKIPI